MTNKLPKIGERYRSKLDNYIMLVSNVEEKFTYYRYELGGGTLSIQYTIVTSEFYERFEEISEARDKVEEAKEELKKVMFNSPSQLPRTAHEDTLCKYIGYLEDRSQNLVNALESIKKPKTNMKEESVDTVKVNGFMEFDATKWDLSQYEKMRSEYVSDKDVGDMKEESVDAVDTKKDCNYCTRRLDDQVTIGDGCCSWDCANDWSKINFKEPVKKTEESLPKSIYQKCETFDHQLEYGTRNIDHHLNNMLSAINEEKGKVIDLNVTYRGKYQCLIVVLYEK